MNVMLLLAQVAPALTDSIAGANPVLTQVNASDEMNLWSMAIKGGWIMIVLGLMSVLCFYILFERNYVIRKAGKEDPQFMDKIKDYILGGELKAAIAYCRSVDTPSARMIEKGISRLGRPVNDVQAAIENVGNIEVAKLEKGMTIMATISGGAPMLGFLGTVTGMVRAFWQMANAGNNIDITLLSGGIYEDDYYGGRFDSRYHSYVCLQLPGDIDRWRGQQDGSQDNGIHGFVERTGEMIN